MFAQFHLHATKTLSWKMNVLRETHKKIYLKGIWIATNTKYILQHSLPPQVYRQSNIISSLFLSLIQLFKYYMSISLPTGYHTLNAICPIENFLSCWWRSVLNFSTTYNVFFLHKWQETAVETVVMIGDHIYQLCMCMCAFVCFCLSIYLKVQCWKQFFYSMFYVCVKRLLVQLVLE